jgi:hypothetical protein
MRVAAQSFRCGACETAFAGELVQHAPAGVLIASMRAVYCPGCGADWRRLFLVATPAEEKPTPEE